MIVDKSDGEGGEPGSGAESASGSSSVTTGGSGATPGGGSAVSDGGSVASTGGNASGASLGGTGSTSGGASSTASTGGSAGSPAKTSYVEKCGAPEPASNDDRDSALDLSAGATICLDAGDEDWFYLDAPDDGKGHVILLDFEEEPTAWVSVNVLAEKDGSAIGSTRLAQGVKASVYATVGPGTRTLFQFSPFVGSQALTKVKATLSAESDDQEPNNEREAAATIQAGSEISAQLWVPYVAADEGLAVDWYKVDLSAGSHVLHVTSTPEDLYLEASLSDSARVALDSGRAPNRGATFNFAFNVASAGTYFIQIENFVGLPLVMLGAKPKFLSEPYKFQID